MASSLSQKKSIQLTRHHNNYHSKGRQNAILGAKTKAMQGVFHALKATIILYSSVKT